MEQTAFPIQLEQCADPLSNFFCGTAKLEMLAREVGLRGATVTFRLVNVCISVISSISTLRPSRISHGNGVQTPQPTQHGTFEKCNGINGLARGTACSQAFEQKTTFALVLSEERTQRQQRAQATRFRRHKPHSPICHKLQEDLLCSRTTSFSHTSLEEFVRWQPGVGPRLQDHARQKLCSCRCLTNASIIEAGLQHVV